MKLRIGGRAFFNRRVFFIYRIVVLVIAHPQSTVPEDAVMEPPLKITHHFVIGVMEQFSEAHDAIINC